jgi:hypothetical protein
MWKIIRGVEKLGKLLKLSHFYDSNGFWKNNNNGIHVHAYQHVEEFLKRSDVYQNLHFIFRVARWLIFKPKSQFCYIFGRALE